MSTVIYISGTIAAKDIIPSEIGLKIASIKDGWNGQAFKVDGNYIDFIANEMEGFDPFRDGVDFPLKKLMEIANKNSLLLRGNIYIKCDCSDYDDMVMHIKDSQITYGNSQIENASTEELVEELINRKMLPETFLSDNVTNINMIKAIFPNIDIRIIGDCVHIMQNTVEPNPLFFVQIPFKWSEMLYRRMGE